VSPIQNILEDFKAKKRNRAKKGRTDDDTTHLRWCKRWKENC